MSTSSILKAGNMPVLLDDFFRPWNEWFDTGGLAGRMLTVPAVNIADNINDFTISLAAPGMKKEDFKILIDGQLLTIKCENENTAEENDARYTRKEYNYACFSRSFTLPEEVNKEQIDARYQDGVLNLRLPKKDEARQLAPGKQINVK
jgi:HSP20 family protein